MDAVSMENIGMPVLFIVSQTLEPSPCFFLVILRNNKCYSEKFKNMGGFCLYEANNNIDILKVIFNIKFVRRGDNGKRS